MKIIFFILIFLLSINPIIAGSINTTVYKTMSAQSYRNNYNRQVNYKPVPYWQAQADYSTRNKMYSTYQNSNLTNNNYSIRSYR